MDAVGFGKPVVFGMSEGGPQAIVFAAKRPERTRALIVYGSFSFLPGGSSWDDLDRDPAELRARYLPEFGGEVHAVDEPDRPLAGNGPRCPLGVGQRRNSEVLVPVGPLDAPARNVRAHERQPGDAASDNGIELPDRRDDER